MATDTAEQTPGVLPVVAPNDRLASLAAHLRSPGTTTGTKARLRRADPRYGSRDALFEAEMMFQSAGIQAIGVDANKRWFAVLHCIAIAEGRHAPNPVAGAALAALDVSEARVRQLVEADFETLLDLLPRLARRVAAAGVTMNWWPLANLLRYTDAGDPTRDQLADAARRDLVADYLRAKNEPKEETP